MALTSFLRMGYKKIASHRYVVISILAITLVLLVTWDEEESISENNYVRAETDFVGELKVSHDNNIQSKFHKNKKNRLIINTGKQHKTRCPPNGEPRQIILLTYGRSGSSLTADILQQHPDVFFYYEPLHNLAKSFTQLQKNYKRTHGKHLHLTSISDYNKEAERVIELLMTCNYTHLPPPAYRNIHLKNSPDTRHLQHCIQTAKVNFTKVLNCLKLQSRVCGLKSVQFIKTIRLTVESVGNLMRYHPNLQLIYLNRDPRGSYLSKLKAFPWEFSKNATHEALRLCPRLEKDVRMVHKLFRKFPNRVHITRYESLAEDPVGVSREMYDFLCLDFTPAIEKHIRRNNMAGKNNGTYSVQRQDGKAASYAWRSKMPIEQAIAFDEICGDVYTKLGYLPVENEEHLRDMDRPLMQKVAGVV